MSATQSRAQDETESCGQAARLVVGLGSPHGDDQAGWLAADRLAERLSTPWLVRKIPGAFDLLSLLENQEELIVIDAAGPAGRPGRVRVIHWPCGDFAEGATESSHGVGLVNAFRLAEVLGCLPRSVRVCTIEAQSCEPLAEVSRPILDAVHELVACVLHELSPREAPCTKPRS